VARILLKLLLRRMCLAQTNQQKVMAISVKSKFAGFLRGLMGRADDRTPARAVTPAESAPAPAPARKNAASPTTASTASSPAAQPLPIGARASSLADEIELPLNSIVACLPLDLRAKLMTTPPANQTIHLQAEMVIRQLAFGAVKISFGELRSLAPGVFVNSGGEFDNKLVNLPLQEILPRLHPELLARRAARRVEVSDEIVGPFAERGRGFTFTTQPLKASHQQQPEPEPEPEPSTPISFAPAAGGRQMSPPPLTPSIPSRSVTPASPAPGLGASPTPISPLSPRSITPASPIGNGGAQGANGTNGTNGHSNGSNGHNGHTNGHANGNGSSNGNGNGHGHGLSPTPGLRLGPLNNGPRPEPPPPTKMAAAPSLAPASAPLPATPTPTPNVPVPLVTIFAPLSSLSENWPADLREEINNSPLAQAKVPLDASLIVPGLKRGRVMATWKQLRLLAQPGSAVSPKDNVEVELPLKVIAPLFLAAQKNPQRPQTKAEVSAEIPDLFFGFPQPSAPPVAPAALPPTPFAAASPAAPAAPAPVIPALTARPTAPVIPPLPKAAESKAVETNFYVWAEKGEVAPADDTASRLAEIPQTDFMSRLTHPKDVVKRAALLPGVIGSVVAMQDGLRVASQAPAELNPDTLAAFLPQIYERVNQCTRELRMGALNNISFTVGNIPWKIFRVNAVYFAAFGRPGEQLPTAQLAQLATELDRKKQS
jgi:predicted regulator of Ras-like GTPase activity (Roadblock/LC7/MglB family)